MCGIIGYCGEKPAVPILLDGLSALEYRGYDSAGITVLSQSNGKSEALTLRAVGRLSNLKEKADAVKISTPGALSVGIGHTRWATHGEPSERNCHPHVADSLSLVHNGIIENYAPLRRELSECGCAFTSETDTEVAAKLIGLYYDRQGSEKAPVKAILQAIERMRGSFAFGIIFNDIPDTLFAVRRDSPLIVARGEDEGFIASDVTAILAHTKDCIHLPEETVAVLRRDGIEFFVRNEGESSVPFAVRRVELPTEHIDWSFDEAQKGGYAHFMLKEIHDQPSAIRRTVQAYLSDGLPRFGIPFIDSGQLLKLIKGGGVLHIVACGTAMHAGLVGKYLTEKYARVPVNVETASEFRYRDPILHKHDCVILLSQSGETADTLAALRHAKAQGIYTLAIVNVKGSTVAREADGVLYTPAGPEIAVASTKAYSVQCVLLFLLALHLALGTKKIGEDAARGICSALESSVPLQVEKMLSASRRVAQVAESIKNSEHIFYIGRGLDHSLCVEGSLKLKEISYIHSEAYACGELKHGTISLITEGVPVIALITDPSLYEKTVSGIREVISRGARVIVFISERILEEENRKGTAIPSDELISLPSAPELCRANEALYRPLMLFPAICALQLLAYGAAEALGLDVDKPRNLAKAVTVE